MQDTNLPEKSFDCIIDKGLLDSLLCGVKGSEAVENYIQEVSFIFLFLFLLLLLFINFFIYRLKDY